MAATFEGLDYSPPQEPEKKRDRFNLPSFADILGMKSENALLNWHGLFGGEKRNKVDSDPEVLDSLNRHHSFMSNMTGLGLQAVPFLGQALGGMGVIKDLIPSRGRIPGQKATGKNVLRGGVPAVKMKEPWEMSKYQYLKREPLPPMEILPEKGQFPAVETDDGSIYVDKSPGPSTHVLFIEKMGIPPERLKSGGWIKDGVYEGSIRSDTGKYAEQMKAKKQVEHRLLVDKAVEEGKPVPEEVLKDYPGLKPEPLTDAPFPQGAVETGKSVKFRYLHNKEKSPYLGSKFAQDIEPSGKYIASASSVEPSEAVKKVFDFGVIEFKNPLVLENKTTRHGGWKTDLSNKYGGKTGKALSKAVMKDGYDGIVTIDKGRISESVILSKPSNPTNDLDALIKEADTMIKGFKK